MFNVFLLLLFYFLENSLYSIHARHLFKMYSTQLFDHIIIILFIAPKMSFRLVTNFHYYKQCYAEHFVTVSL